MGEVLGEAVGDDVSGPFAGEGALVAAGVKPLVPHITDLQNAGGGCSMMSGAV